MPFFDDRTFPAVVFLGRMNATRLSLPSRGYTPQMPATQVVAYTFWRRPLTQKEAPMNEYVNRRRHYGLLATGLLMAAAMPFDLAVADAPGARARAGSASTALSASDLQALARAQAKRDCKAAQRRAA